MKDSETLRLQGITFAKSGQFEQASERFQQAIQQDPNNYALYNDLGLSLSRQGKFQEAETHYLLAIEKCGTYVEGLNNLASLYYKQEQFEKALNFYKKAILIDPDYLAAHYNMALIYMRLEQFNEAVSSFKKVLSLSPQHSRAHFHLANLLVQQNQIAEAESHYQAAISLQPAMVSAYANLAAIHLKHQRVEDAKHYYEQALNFDPNLPEAHFNMGVILADQGKVNEAIRHYQYVITLSPDHAQAFQNLGACYYKQNNLSLAIQCYEKALTLSPADPILSYLLKALKKDRTQETAPLPYVNQLFDQYANDYDHHLKTLLLYQAPSLLKMAVEHHIQLERDAWDILDLGCGTGLMGEMIKPYARYLLGVDLSKKMLLKAENKAIYDDLICDDIETFMAHCHMRFNIILAADVLPYMGKLEELFRSVFDRLKENGFFAFSIELAEQDEEEFCLQPTGRFQHSQRYIHDLADKYQFSICYQQQETIRLQQGLPVPGVVFLVTPLRT